MTLLKPPQPKPRFPRKMSSQLDNPSAGDKGVARPYLAVTGSQSPSVILEEDCCGVGCGGFSS